MLSETLIFDFDGTIADTYELSLKLVREAVPGTTDESFKKLFEGDIGTVVNESKKLQAIDFHGKYSRHILEQHIVPSLSEIIPQLATSYRLFIISSSQTEPINAFLHHHKLKQYFAKIYGLDVHPNKTEKFRTVLAEYRLDPTNCLMITDTLGDINQAHAANINTIAVSWGVHPEDTLRRGHPVTILESPLQLRQAVEDYFNETEEF